MVFKLVRTDCAEPSKIQLPVGTHMIGRGKFLDCDDKRVSRNHGQLTVDDDSVIIKALHQNPCFYQKKGTQQTEILKQNFTFELNHGDRFGLLPDIFWFEVLHCTSLDSNANVPPVESNFRPLQNGAENTQITHNTDVTNGIGDRAVSGATEIQDNIDDEDLPNIDFNDTVEEANRAESPSMIAPPADTRDGSPLRDQLPLAEAQSPPHQAAAQPSSVQDTPTKRSHSPEPAESPKKIKTEPVDVKQEPDSPSKPGPSHMGAPNPDPAAASASSAAPGGRERCWYGASCYRKNPQHKLDFSHPSDSDWGQSSRIQCPYGRQCRKADARHWRDHDHPDGTRPPMAARAPPAKRKPAQKRKKTDSDDSDNSGRDSPAKDLIVTGKRARKPVVRPSYSGSEAEDDPYDTDGSDDWKPDSADLNRDSQNSVFSTQDI